jgi:hypothetical protein
LRLDFPYRIGTALPAITLERSAEGYIFQLAQIVRLILNRLRYLSFSVVGFQISGPLSGL